MHNIDRTVDEMEFLDEFEQDFSNEFESDYETDQGGEFEEGEFEFESEFEDTQGENSDEFESDNEFESDMEMESDYELESDNEVIETELATQLLSVNNEDEMEEFLGKLFKKVKRAAGKFIQSPTGNLLRNYLKGLAKKTLPIASTALGGAIGGPLGAKVAGGASQMVGKALGLELEGLSPEDREFEIAKGYIRFAKDAINRAAADRNNRHSPGTAARSAMTKAAKRHAPGFLSPRFADHYRKHLRGRGRTRGTWVRRRDGSVVLYGL
ncbi:MAG: hypothetical protein H7122_00845 [Chitinophagaceae bacterium]|nr:hypothetical protein [Chitinophagaceae bacterium]